MNFLFEASQEALGPRVRLSALDLSGLEAMEAWLALALAREWRFEQVRDAVEAGNGVLVADLAGESIGLVIVDAVEHGDAGVGLISIDPARRYRGLGGEAGLALERHLRSNHGVERVYASVPDTRGLAVYFWLRLGYRPLTMSSAPGPVESLGAPLEGIWMLRDGD